MNRSVKCGCDAKRKIKDVHGSSAFAFGPRINQINAAVIEVCGIAGCQLSSFKFGDRRDLGNGMADGSTQQLPMSGYFGEKPRSIALKTKNTPAQIFCKQAFGGTQQLVAAFALCE